MRESENYPPKIRAATLLGLVCIDISSGCGGVQADPHHVQERASADEGAFGSNSRCGLGRRAHFPAAWKLSGDA